MLNDIALSTNMDSVLNSMKRATRQGDESSMRLATGRRVNSVVDQPQSYFISQGLKAEAGLFNSILDGMNIGVRTIQETLSGLQAIEKILELAEYKALEAQEILEETGSALPNTILADEPVGYFRLGDSNGATANNLGTLGDGGDGIYTNGVGQSKEILFYGAGELAADFNGIDQYVDIPNDDSINLGGPFPERTVELIFQADSTNGRQILWEEGGPVNNLSIYIDDGTLRVNGRTTNGAGYGPLDISVPIQSDVVYHVAFTQDGPEGRFTAYLNGEQFGAETINSFIGNHPNPNAIGSNNGDAYFHDGPTIGLADGVLSFDGLMSDVAIYNKIISEEGMRERYENTSLPLSESLKLEVDAILSQIDGVVEDTHFRGVGLLQNDNLVVDLNADKSNKLKVEGQDFSLDKLGLSDVLFQRPSQTERAINNIRQAITQIREYTASLQTSLSVINVRQDFTEETINTFEAGADDLTLANVNEEAANQLTAQTRLQLSTSMLAIVSQSRSSILNLVGPGSDLFNV